MKEIDARGLACPAPVLNTKAAIEEEHINYLKIIVDNEPAMENVYRFLEHNGYKTATDQRDDCYIITGELSAAPLKQVKESAVKKNEEKKIMVMCATDRIGFGDNELGLKLMISFIKTLKEMGPELWRLVLVNNGVKMVVDGSDVLPILKEYARQGLQIMVCGTCLTHFNLLDKKQVGETTNMLDIITAMQLADKVINI